MTVATPNQRPTGQGSRSNTEKSSPDTLRRSPRIVAIWVVSVIVCCAQYGRFYDRYDLNAVDFPYKSLVMIGIAALALIAIAVYATQLGFHERMARFGLALILAGAFGNLIDRAVFGFVVDFVDVYWRTAHFWAFNVADSAITIGAILVLLDMIGLGRRHASYSV